MAIELHHTYTLIHDDLPAMDNDDFRRGRLSSHKKFTEHDAILAGDALLNISYEYIAQIKSPALSHILQEFTRATGAKGLILGQVKDLGNEENTMENILDIHRLKTGELIQLCLTSSAILKERNDLVRPLYQVGMALGTNFQLLDDLCELTDEINEHEGDVNPFLLFDPKESLDIIRDNNVKIREICKENKLFSLQEYIENYLDKTKLKIENGIVKINKHIKFNLSDINL